MTDTPTKRKIIGRWRQLAGWSLLIVGLLVTCLWISTIWWGFGYAGPTRVLEAGAGWCRIGVSAGDSSYPFSNKGWYTGRPWDQWRWLLPIRANIGGTDFPREWNYHIVSVERYRWSTTDPAGAIVETGVTCTAYVLLWPVVLALFTASGACLWLARHARRRADKSVCHKCRYNLAGLPPDTPCPECGATHP